MNTSYSHVWPINDKQTPDHDEHHLVLVRATREVENANRRARLFLRQLKRQRARADELEMQVECLRNLLSRRAA